MTDPTQFTKLLRHLQEIPDKVIVHFIRLARHGKTPTGFWKLPKSFMDGEQAKHRLAHGLNVGIIARSDGLAFIDIDVEGGSTKLPEERVNLLLETMDTFTVKTANGGYHLIFINTGIIVNKILKYSGKTIGELRANWEYIVATGSYVSTNPEKATPDATGTYSVFRDVSIKPLRLEDIPPWIELGEEGNAVTQLNLAKDKMPTVLLEGSSIATGTVEGVKNALGKTLEEVRNSGSDYCKELDEYLKGAEHKGGFGSRSEADFRTVKILWKFGFDELQIATILRSLRPYEKTQRIDYLSRTIYRAIEQALALGWVQGWTLAPQSLPVTSLDRISIRELPENLPDKKYILVRGIPRSGKTRWAVQQLVKAHEGIFVSHRHSITRHAIEEFKKQTSTKTAVLLMGKDACCNREDGEKGRCVDCPKRLVADDLIEEGDGVSRTQYFREAYTLLRENHVLTDREIPQHLCPHFTLKFAERYANYCFTVPFFYSNEDKTVLIKPRALVVLDEDPVVDYFSPTTIELAEYLSKSGRVYNAKNLISDYLSSLDELENHISNLIRRYASDRRILDIIRVIRDEINPIIARLVDSPSKEYKEDLVNKLNAINLPIFSEEERLETLKRVKHHLKELPTTFHVSITGLFEPILFPAQVRYLWIGHNPNTLYLVGDRTIIRHTDAQQLVIIGSTNAELFLEQLCAESPQDAVVFDIAEFPYKDNFIVFRLNGETKKHEDRMMLKFIRLLAERNRNRDDPAPSMILTSSKKNQEHFWDRLQSAAIMSRDETADQQITNWLTGKLNIFYTNSTLSRGVDVPYYDALLVHSCTYAQPYWESEIKRAQENGDLDAQMRARMIRAYLIGDELTNSVLRHSPVYGVREEQAKFIVVKSKDFDKISDKVTQGMVVVDIQNDTELRRVAATVPEMVTRASQSGVRGKVGFYDVFSLPDKASTSLTLTQVKEGTAIVLGKNGEEAKAFFEKGIAAVISHPKPRDTQYLELFENIKTYPSFLKGCRAQRHAIVRWMHKRYPKVSERKVRSVLKRMALEGVLVQSTEKHGKIIYTIRKCNYGERGTPLLSAAGCQGSHPQPIEKACVVNGQDGGNSDV